MTTRGTFGVRVDGQDKLTYNHSDSYPESPGLGSQLVEQIKTLLETRGLETVREQARALRLVDEDDTPSAEEIERLRALRLVDEDDTPSAEEIERLRGHANTNVRTTRLTDWYCLLRNLQGDLIGLLDAGVMTDADDFICRSLHCEYGYIVNLDDEVFEVYEGFQREPHGKGRYAREMPDRSGFYPCALVGTFPLAAIPDDWIAQAFPGNAAA